MVDRRNVKFGGNIPPLARVKDVPFSDRKVKDQGQMTGPLKPRIGGSGALCAGYDPTAVRLPFDCSSTALRAFRRTLRPLVGLRVFGLLQVPRCTPESP